MKFIALVACVMIQFASSSVSGLAQEVKTGPIAATPGALEALNFLSGLEVDDFVFVFGEPIMRNRIPFAVLNAGSETAVAPRFAISSTANGSGAMDDSARVFPTSIEPGAFGFGEAYFESGFINDDAEYLVTAMPPDDDAGKLRTLNLTQVSGIPGTGKATGTIENVVDDDVESVEIHVLCIEESGIITNYGFEAVDTPAMEPDQYLGFETELPENCGNLWFMTAIAVV